MISISSDNIKTAMQTMVIFPKEVKLAALNAVNRTLTKTRTEVAKTIRKKYVIKSSDIKNAMKSKRARADNIQAEIIAKGRPIPLAKFRTTTPKRGPMKVKVLRSAPLRRVQGMFVGNSRQGFKGAMMRTTKRSYPLRVPYGPSIPTMFETDRTMNIIEPFAQDYLNKRFLHELDYRISQIGGK